MLVWRKEPRSFPILIFFHYHSNSRLFCSFQFAKPSLHEIYFLHVTYTFAIQIDSFNILFVFALKYPERNKRWFKAELRQVYRWNKSQISNNSSTKVCNISMKKMSSLSLQEMKNYYSVGRILNIGQHHIIS